ncbi:hypothetical protein KSC_084950 [Ktedonobacter sp. SOSP1-52]|nr:hypothetical protein KSC_084950 [Ktedonobacter sp. SOSP1-52]
MQREEKHPWRATLAWHLSICSLHFKSEAQTPGKSDRSTDQTSDCRCLPYVGAKCIIPQPPGTVKLYK